VASISPEIQPEAQPIPVNMTWLEMAQAGEVPSLTALGPRPPGEVGHYGPDVANSLTPDAYPTGSKE
jgi:hypothetical protein